MTRSPTASHVEQTHLGSERVGVGSGSRDSSRGRRESGGRFSSSLSSSQEETIIGKGEGINFEDGSQAEEGTITELGSQAKRFSSNLTSLIIIISLQCG